MENVTSLFKALPLMEPAGESLHGTVWSRDGAESFGNWIRMVGRLHGAKKRRGVAAEFADLGYRDEGEYAYDARTGDPLALRVPLAARVPELAFVHALGLYLDREHLGDGAAPASEGDPAARAVVDAALAAPSLAESRAFVRALGARIAERADRPPFLDEGREAWERASHADLMRLLSPPEVFARAYAQFVAEMVRPPAMRTQIGRRMTEIREAGALPLFWEAGEFVPIARLLQALLLEKGLAVWKA